MQLEISRKQNQTRRAQREANARSLFASGSAEYIGRIGGHLQAQIIAGKALPLEDSSGRKVTAQDTTALACGVCGQTHKLERIKLTHLFRNKGTGIIFAISQTCLGEYVKRYAKKITGWENAASFLTR